MLDVLIRGGDLVDGAGGPRRRVDVGISDSRIVAIGSGLGNAKHVVDASDRIVAPGFIDVHTHLDAQAFWDTTLSPSPLLGVTTVFGGNCGFSIAPLESSEADYLARMLARVEGMPLEALRAGVPWNWRTSSEYFNRLEGSLAINAGFMVGHSAIRRVVMGAEANARPCTPNELVKMQELLRSGLRGGGLGFSTTRSSTHNDGDGNPVPSRFADREELVALAGVCREFRGTSLEYLPNSPPTMPLAEAEFEVMVAMSKAAQSPMNWNVIQVRESNRERVNERLEVGRRALEKGARIVMLVMPQPFAVQFTFRTGFVLDAFPGWKDVMSLPPADKLRVLCDQSARRRLERLAAQDDGRKSMAQWESHVIVETFTPETKQYEGRIVGDIAREQGKTPFDALLDIVIRDDLWTYFRPTATEESHDDWVFRAEVCRDHRSLIGASDAGAHLDMMATQDYTANVLANFVRRHNVMTLEEAVHLISEAPAKLYGLQGRGLLQEGSYGDVVIFDENTIDSTPWAKRTDLPGGASRLYTEGVGIDHVFVNGREVVNHGEFNENRPGVLLHSGRDTYDPPMVL